MLYYNKKKILTLLKSVPISEGDEWVDDITNLLPSGFNVEDVNNARIEYTVESIDANRIEVAFVPYIKALYSSGGKTLRFLLTGKGYYTIGKSGVIWKLLFSGKLKTVLKRDSTKDGEAVIKFSVNLSTYD